MYFLLIWNLYASQYKSSHLSYIKNFIKANIWKLL